MHQHRDTKEIEKQLNKEFENVCDWFFDYTFKRIKPNLFFLRVSIKSKVQEN